MGLKPHASTGCNLKKTMPEHEPDPKIAAEERRSQLRFLLIAALAAILFAIVRAHPSRIFNPGWWRLW